MKRVGLGCMAMAGVYGPADESESIATIHAALPDDVFAQIEAAVPDGAAAGDRYPEAGMAVLDSER